MRRFRSLAVPVAAWMLLTSDVRADAPPTDDQKAAARLFGTEGVRLALAGDCQGAVDKLSRAEALVHAPTTTVPLARCEIQLGKLVVGTERLNRLVREVLPPGSPQSWVDAQKQGQSLLDATEPKIAKLRIHVERAPGLAPDAAFQIAVDGESVAPVLLDNDRPTDPGAHHVTLTGAGQRAAASDITLASGQSQSITLRAEPDLSASASTLPTAQDAAVPPPPSVALIAPTPANHTAAFASLGVGGVGLAIGTVFGVLALAAQSRLNSECNIKKICPATSQSDIDAMHTDSIVSTIGFGVGIAGAALGMVFLLTSHGDQPVDAVAPKTARGVRPWVGPGAAGVLGSF